MKGCHNTNLKGLSLICCQNWEFCSESGTFIWRDDCEDWQHPEHVNESLGAQPEGYEGQQYGKFTTRNKSSCMKGGVSSVSFNQRPSIQVQHAFCLGEEKGRSCSVYRSRVRVTCCTYRRGRPQVPVDVKPPRTPCDCLMYRPGVTDSTSCDYENSPSGK